MRLVTGQIDAAEIQLSLRTVGVNISIEDANRILLRSGIGLSLSNIWITLLSYIGLQVRWLSGWLEFCSSTYQILWYSVSLHPDMIYYIKVSLFLNEKTCGGLHPVVVDFEALIAKSGGWLQIQTFFPLNAPFHLCWCTNDAIFAVMHFVLKHLKILAAHARLLFINLSSNFNSIQPRILLNKLWVNAFLNHNRWNSNLFCTFNILPAEHYKNIVLVFSSFCRLLFVNNGLYAVCFYVLLKYGQGWYHDHWLEWVARLLPL